MKTNKKIFFLLLIVLFISSCKLTKKLNNLVDKIFGKADDITEKVISSLDNAIGQLNSAQANYQEILQKLIEELPQEVHSTITNDVSNLLNRTIAAAGAEFKCNIDFLRIRVQQALIRIKAKFLNQPMPPIEPQLCMVVPLAIDMNLVPQHLNKLEFYGYDFDLTNIEVILENVNNRINVTDKLDIPTHYHMTINLGSNGVRLSNKSKRLILRWNNKDISTIAVIQPNPNICESSTYQFQPPTISYMPPLTYGDREFAGNGPEVTAYVNLRIEDRRKIIARVYMKAKENKKNWTTAEGFKDFIIYTSDPNKVIESIITPTSDSYFYIDDNIYMDEFPGSGLVRKFRFMGDGEGDDVGYHTRVEIDFNNIRIQLKEAEDCISSQVLEALEIRQMISESLKNRLKLYKQNLHLINN